MADEQATNETDNTPDIPLDTGSVEETSETSEETTSPAEGNEAETNDSTEESQVDTPKPDETETSESEEELPKPDDSDKPDLKSMTRAERADYFKSQRSSQLEQVNKTIDEAYQPQPLDELVQEYIDKGFTEGEAYTNARLDVADQQNQLNSAKGQIAETQAMAYMEAYDVVNSFDWMNHTKPDSYDKATVDAASSLYEQFAVVRDDRTNQIVGYNMMPKQFYGMIDQIRNSGSKQATIKGQKAAEQQMAAVAPSSSTRQPVKSGNSLKDMEERLKDTTF